MTIVYGILGLGFLVFFHETGHFIAARIFGVKVESFSVGMGPVLLHHTFKGTDYRLSLIPLGGYCGMKGEQDYQKAIEENLSEIKGDKDSFYGVHPFKRLLIAFAGPFFNLLFAFIAFFVIALMGYTYYSAGTTVAMADEVYEDMTSIAHESGMQSGDTIIAINNKEMNDFSDILTFISTHPDEDVVIKCLRNGEEIDISVHTQLDKETGAGRIGIVADGNSVAAREYPSHSFFEAIKEGIIETNSNLALVIKSVGILFKGIDVTKAVSGPARITTMLGETVKEGFTSSFHNGVISTLQFLALISISLFFTNLLPVPILDGGLILFALI